MSDALRLVLILLGMFWIVSLAVSLWRQCVERRHRRLWLLGTGRVRTWEEVKATPRSFSRIVLLNWHYGREVWAVEQGERRPDDSWQAVEAGYLVLPRPWASEVRRFCREEGIELVWRGVKRSRH